MNISMARNTSNAFYIAGQRCGEQRPLAGGNFQWPMVPTIVNFAFSIELAFKYFLHAAGTPPGRVHGLAELFVLLDPSIQGRLAAIERDGRAAFDARLAAVADAFAKWRYVFEDPEAIAKVSGPHFGFLVGFAAAVQRELGFDPAPYAPPGRQ